MMRKIFLLLLCLASSQMLTLFVAPVVFAHIVPVGCVPRAGINLAEPPEVVLCLFTAPLVLEKSKLEVYDAQGNRVDKGDAKPFQGDAVSLLASLDRAKMKAGIYTIRWTTFDATDNSTVSGTIEFGVNTVVPPTPTAVLPGFVMTPQPVASSPTAQAPTELVSRFLIAAGVVLLGAVGFLYWRMRRESVIDKED